MVFVNEMKKEHKILLILFILTLVMRLSFAFMTPNFTYDSYFHLRQVDYLTETGFPMYHDELSYGGRFSVYLPAFYYLVSFFDLILPLEMVAKILPNLLFSLCILLVYLIAKKMVKKERPALFSAFLAGFVPVLWETNSFNPLSLFLPLILLAIYSFMNLNEKKFVYLYVVVLVLVSLVSSATFLLVVGLLFYLFFSKLEEKRIAKADLELSLFSLFLFLWLQFLFFKDVLLGEGLSFIWGNIPSQIFYQYYPENSILFSFVLVGVVPFLAGLVVIYQSFFKEKNKNIFLIFSLALSTIFLIVLGLIEYKTGLAFFGLILAILSAQFYKHFLKYISQTKVVQFKKVITWVFVLFVIVISGYISLSYAWEQEVPSGEEKKAFEWLRDNVPEKSIVLTSLKEGHAVSYLAGKKNVMDDRFSLMDNVVERFEDLRLMFTTSYQTTAINLLDEYAVDYIFFSAEAKDDYGIEGLNYLDKKCFELIYGNTIQIYKVKCQMEIR